MTMKKTEMFVEVDHVQRQKAGNEICGDVFLSRKIQAENRTIIILADGLGSGVKANILATMTASMAMNFICVNSPIEHTARIIMRTLPVDTFRKISFSSFTIIDIEGNRKVRLIEFGNPLAILWKSGNVYEPTRQEININEGLLKQQLFTSEFEISLNDSIVLFSDGITQSGMGNENMPFGWGREQLSVFLITQLEDNQEIPAGELAEKVLQHALKNDRSMARDDMSCGVVCFREPRKILFCTGPPFRKEHDAVLAEQVKNFDGDIIVSGGTTSQILSRELKKEVEVKLDPGFRGLPPASEMEGVDLVTEGILTLGKVSEYLRQIDHLGKEIAGPAGKIINYFSRNDEIIFLVGTRVNDAHQDPSLPVELEIRRNVIKKIARLLEDKFLKKTEINYI
jgi:Stage II sporulation protein E (SpoIIE)